MSHFQTLGLTVKVHDPLILGGGYLYSLGVQVRGYSHTISAFGGFDSATLTLSGKTVDIEEWLERGLGRHIQIWCDDLVLAWEGFVDQVDLSQGALAASVGPLMDVGNRVLTYYAPLDTTLNPPKAGPQTTNTLATDADSQALYGIWEKDVSIGQATAADANYARRSFINERQTPARSQTLSNSGGDASTVTLSLRGYFYWLTAYKYVYVAGSGTTDVTTQITRILTANPNTLVLSADYTRLDANAMLVPQYENDGTYADTLIKSLVALGDASGNRWTFGFYENRRAFYSLAPTTLEYRQNLQSQDQSVYGIAGARVRPWLVRPGKWLFLNDFLVGKPVSTTLRSDPRNLFIEQVNYTVPYSLSLSGGRLAQLGQVLSQISMGGIF